MDMADSPTSLDYLHYEKTVVKLFNAPKSTYIDNFNLQFKKNLRSKWIELFHLSIDLCQVHRNLVIKENRSVERIRQSRPGG